MSTRLKRVEQTLKKTASQSQKTHKMMKMATLTNSTGKKLQSSEALKLKENSFPECAFSFVLTHSNWFLTHCKGRSFERAKSIPTGTLLSTICVSRSASTTRILQFTSLYARSWWQITIATKLRKLWLAMHATRCLRLKVPITTTLQYTTKTAAQTIQTSFQIHWGHHTGWQ